MIARHARLLALALWLAALALTGLFVVLVFVNAPSPGPLDFADFLFMLPIYAAVTMALPTVGALIVARRPDHTIGWLFCGSGIAMAGGFCLQLYGDTAVHLRTGWPFGGAALAVGGPLFIVGMATGTLFMMFLFPTGRPLPGMWRRVFTALAVLFGLSVLATVIAPTLSQPFDDLANPLAVPGLGALAAATAATLNGMAPLVAFLAVASLVVRFRRSRGVERQQMKWFAYAAGFMGGSLAIGYTFSSIGWELASDVMWVAAMVGLAFLPLAVGMAILRYRLYEIDRIVSRTVSYALVTGVLIAVYAGGVLLLGRLLAPVTRESDVAVAASTLLVAALFQPIRRRVQSAVDHRFNRARYDAERTVEGFAAALRDEVHLEDLRDQLIAAVGLTVAPSTASVWLRGPEQRP